MRAFWASLTPEQRRTLRMMAAVVAGLHLLGITLLLLVTTPAHPGLAGAGSLSIGIGVTAYTLGLRHAFDADHISAIDNTTRALMAQGRRPLSVGFWFSLGHSTVVFALSAAFAAGMHAVIGPVSHRGSLLHRTSSLIGTGVSGGFLFLIGAVNIVILLEVVKVFLAMRSGRYDEAALEARLRQRGLMNRLFGRLTQRIARPVQMYPIGLLFGLGFDTATEVGLLVIAGSAGAAGLPWYAMLCLPLLFAAGMSLMDSIDGSLMHLAYGWAFARPVRRVFYNMTVTGLSVVVAGVIGTIELGGLAGSELNLSGRFWSWLEHVDLNQLGFVIVGLFVVTWIVALAVWRWGRIEQRWSAAPGGVGRAR